jgi:hypothetical protein
MALLSGEEEEEEKPVTRTTRETARSEERTGKPAARAAA